MGHGCSFKGVRTFFPMVFLESNWKRAIFAFSFRKFFFLCYSSWKIQFYGSKIWEEGVSLFFSFPAPGIFVVLLRKSTRCDLSQKWRTPNVTASFLSLSHFHSFWFQYFLIFPYLSVLFSCSLSLSLNSTLFSFFFLSLFLPLFLNSVSLSVFQRFLIGCIICFLSVRSVSFGAF